MEKAAVARCTDYGQAGEAVGRAIKLAGGIPRKKKVLVKVNLLSASPPEECITTHPEVVKAVLSELKRTGAHACVGDQPGFTSLERAARRSGIAEACEEAGAELLEFKETEEYANPHAIIAKRPRLFRAAFDFDLVVNLPKLKTHSLTLYTGAVKNLFGFMPNAQRKFYHVQSPDALSFSRMLLDNYLLIRPGLNVMDGVTGMEGNGPSAGKPRNFGFIAAGRDALALDAVCADILGIYEKVPLLDIARKTGMGQAFLEKIDVSGDKIPKIRDLALPEGSIFQMPTPFLKMARKLTAATPIVTKERCTSCGTCAKACPADAIRMEGGPVFDYGKCVRCYTCQEMCPSKAIVLKEKPAVRAAKSCLRKIR